MIWSVVSADGHTIFEGRRGRMRRVQVELIKLGERASLTNRRVTGYEPVIAKRVSAKRNRKRKPGTQTMVGKPTGQLVRH